MNPQSLLLVVAFLFGLITGSNAQTTFFTDDFEAGTTTWSTSGSAFPNKWVVSTCTNNGGAKAAYISPGGTTPDCSSTGIEHYGYQNALSGSNQTIIYHSVNAGCYNSMTLGFDLQIAGIAAEDYCEVVYSTDNGSTWTATGTQFTGIPTYAPQSVALPAALNQTTFLIGFRFTYNDFSINEAAPAVDNVTIQGTSGDTQAPSVICPASITLYATSTCKGVISDISALATITDNCSLLANMTFSQTPSVGSITLADVSGTLTVTDETGLSSQCTTQFTLVDTISPTVTCPASISKGSGVNCQYILQDLTSAVNNFDNCSTTFTMSQSPVAGTSLADGSHLITITTTDESGNDGTCSFTLIVHDTIAPTLTCPASVQVYGNALCTGNITDQEAFVWATDNCTLQPDLVYSQDLPAGHNFTGATDLIVTLTDEVGNAGTCTIHFTVIDTIAPVVTCQSDTVVTISNPCSYPIPNMVGTHSATEYCTPSNLLSFSQNPVAGTMVSGLQDITITYTDTSGNQGTCITHVQPNDITAPTITCPSTQTVNAGSSCSAALPDYTSLAIVSDNCGTYTLSQNPVAGTILTSGTNAINLIATDAAGNTQSCVTHFQIIENVSPQITCPANVVSCDPHVSYSSPSATDNCLFVMTQTDGTGFTSGSIFPVGTTNQSYLVTDSSGNTATCSFTVQVLDYPDTAKVTVDSIGLCETFSTPISALAIQSGTGSWSVLSGSGTIADPTANITSISGLAAGTTKLIWTVASASCGQLKDTLTVIVSQASSQAALIDTMVVCYTAGSVIQGNVPTSGTGTWSSTSGITFNSIHSPVVQIYNVPEGFSNVMWTVQSYGCPATKDSAILFRPYHAVISQADTTLCIEDFPFVVQGSPIAYHETGVWAILSGQASPGGYSGSSVQLNLGNPGDLVLEYTVHQVGCLDTKDTVTLHLKNCEDAFGEISTIFTPNGDGKNDYFDLGNLGELHPDCEVTIVNRWGSVVFESTGYATPWDGKFNGEDLPLGTYFYSIVSPNDDFEKKTGSISIIR